MGGNGFVERLYLIIKGHVAFLRLAPAGALLTQICTHGSLLCIEIIQHFDGCNLCLFTCLVCEDKRCSRVNWIVIGRIIGMRPFQRSNRIIILTIRSTLSCIYKSDGCMAAPAPRSCASALSPIFKGPTFCVNAPGSIKPSSYSDLI